MQQNPPKTSASNVHTAKDHGMVKAQKRQRSFFYFWETFSHWTHLDKGLLYIQQFINPVVAKRLLKRHGFKVAALCVLLCIMFTRGINIQFGLHPNNNTPPQTQNPPKNIPQTPQEKRFWVEKLASQPPHIEVAHPLAFSSSQPHRIPKATIDGTGISKSAELAPLSIESQQAYIQRFSPVAQAEQKRFGIPASVTLGLAILVSHYGHTEAVRTANNHLHVPCTHNYLQEGVLGSTLILGRCILHFERAWTSFRAHSQMLRQAPFHKISAQAGKDFKAWAHYLEAYHYPNPEFSAQALIQIIEKHKLYTLDQ